MGSHSQTGVECRWQDTPHTLLYQPHTDEAKTAFGEFGIEAMPGWPTYSPDLNPQENVWSWVERALREEEGATDSFITFCKKVIVVAKRYPSAIALMPSMHRRVHEVLKCRGGMTKY